METLKYITYCSNLLINLTVSKSNTTYILGSNPFSPKTATRNESAVYHCGFKVLKAASNVNNEV